MPKGRVKNQDSRVEEFETRITQLEEQLKRAVADYQNLEKRIADGRSELSLWTTNQILSKLLPVLHHFEIALNGASETDKQSGWFKGVSMAVNQFKLVLKEEGLEEVAADGQFDPTLHEAVDMREGEDNTILEVTQKGYTLNGKVLQPAKVVVGKGGSDTSSGSS